MAFSPKAGSKQCSVQRLVPLLANHIGRFDVLPALNSTFEGRSDSMVQTEALRQRLTTLRAGQFEAWVTHQVNITAMPGEVPAMGEAFVVKLGAEGNPGRVLARTRFN